MKHFLLALAVGLSVTACKNEPSPEDIGNDYLSRARVQLKASNYDAAREEIKRLREEVPRAFNAREAGILLMDSINLAEAQEELRRIDSVMRVTPEADKVGFDTVSNHFDNACQKVKFYQRKLQLDRKKRERH